MNGPEDGLPPHVAEQARDYFAAFLGPAATDDALGDLAADAAFFEDHRLADVLANAHLILEERVGPPAHFEALTLHDDVGLSVDEVGRVMGLSHGQVRDSVDTALRAVGEEPRYGSAPGRRVVIVADEEDGPPRGYAEVASGPDAAPEPDRRMLLVFGAFGLAIVLAVAAWLATGPDEPGGASPGGEPVPCPSEGGATCLTSVTLTTDVESGEPDPAVERFGLDEPVVLWFAYEPAGDGEAVPVPAEVRWYRDGELLYPDALRLDPTGWAQSTLAAGYQTDTGSHRVDVVIDGRLAASVPFEVAGSSP